MMYREKMFFPLCLILIYRDKNVFLSIYRECFFLIDIPRENVFLWVYQYKNLFPRYINQAQIPVNKMSQFLVLNALSFFSYFHLLHIYILLELFGSVCNNLFLKQATMICHIDWGWAVAQFSPTVANVIVGPPTQRRLNSWMF